MSTEIVNAESQIQARDWMSPAEIRDHVNQVQRIMEAVMKEGHHYGKIPGCPKPVLFQPGAEKLTQGFRLAVEHDVLDLSTDDVKHFIVTVRISTQDGVLLYSASGSASTDEEKYRWRAAVCDEEFDETPEARRRLKWKKTRNGKAYTTKQIRTNPADLENTVLKMAFKRAMVGATRGATACSDIFAQDIEDLPEGLLENDERQSVEMPKAKKNAQEPTPAAAPVEGARTGTVLRVSEKKGTGAKDWTRYGVQISEVGGAVEWYATFDKTLGGIAHDAQENGATVAFTAKPSEYGFDLLTLGIVVTPHEQATPAAHVDDPPADDYQGQPPAPEGLPEEPPF